MRNSLGPPPPGASTWPSAPCLPLGPLWGPRECGSVVSWSLPSQEASWDWTPTTDLWALLSPTCLWKPVGSLRPPSARPPGSGVGRLAFQDPSAPLVFWVRMQLAGLVLGCASVCVVTPLCHRQARLSFGLRSQEEELAVFSPEGACSAGPRCKDKGPCWAT